MASTIFRKLSTIYKLVCMIFIFIFLSITTPIFAQVQEVRIADATGDWGYPNPFRHYPRGPGYIRMSWIFDTLVWKDQKGYIPALADSWSYDGKKKAFTFKLNPRAKWHDGQKLTADDVVFTINYFKEHPYSWIALDSVKEVFANNPQTVTIVLSKPYSPFVSDIGGTMPILPKHIWEHVAKPEEFNEPGAFIGTGPYIFKDFNKTQGTYLYEAFKDYYRGKPIAERLIYIRSSQPLMSLTTGQADLAPIQPEMADMLRAKGMTVIKDEKGWNKKLMINHKKPPFQDKRFRQALAFAIDRQEIIEKGHTGLASLASYGLLSADHEMYNPAVPIYKFNPLRARQLIESIGYRKDDKGFYNLKGSPLKIELLASKITTAGQNVADRDGEVIKKQLEAVGIAIELVNLEQATTDSRVAGWEFDLAVSGHGGISGDPKMLSEMVLSKYSVGSVNSARYDVNPKLNRLLEQQMAEMDIKKRKKIVFQIQKLYAEELPAISLYYPDSATAYNSQKGIKWYYTKGGISKGVPIAQNKMSLIK